MAVLDTRYDDYCINTDSYQDWAATTDIGLTPTIAAFGLAGEAGEVMEKLKKLMRDDGYDVNQLMDIPMSKLEPVIKEMGDVLWYVATMARFMGVSLSEVMYQNVIKLEKRRAKGTRQGSGDDR